MVNIVIEVSKYLLILLIAAYTYWNFSYFRFFFDLIYEHVGRVGDLVA